MNNGGWEFSMSWGLVFVIIVIFAIAGETLSNIYKSKVELEKLQLQQQKQGCDAKTLGDK